MWNVRIIYLNKRNVRFSILVITHKVKRNADRHTKDTKGQVYVEAGPQKGAMEITVFYEIGM